MAKAFHCFFEQSGTFKKEFKKLGFEAYDYDILNDFGETDFQIDLFKDIEIAYERERERTAFDNVKDGDEIIAFFPCMRFEDQIQMNFRGTNFSLKEWDDIAKLEYDIKLHDELHHLYTLVSKMAIVCLKRGIPLIIENPWSTTHYLTKYWCLKPKVVDKDRTERGDYFVKPTQYWFLNREPSNNLVFDAIAQHPKKIVAKFKPQQECANNKKERSMISPDYAERFIKEFVI